MELPNRKRVGGSSTQLAWPIAGVLILVLLILILWQAVGGQRSATPNDAATDRNLDFLQGLSLASESIAKSGRESVVRIEVRYGAKRNQDADLNSFFGVAPSEEQIGSGVVVGEDGLVVTNWHVVRGADSIDVQSMGGKKSSAALIGFDLLTDLAVIRVKDLTAPVLGWGDSDQLQTGSLVWAIGSPVGLDGSVSMGIVSSTHRESLFESPFQEFLQTDAAINPGQSGGALLDTRGRLVGINTAITGDAFQGIGFSLPSSTARTVVDEIIRTGRVERGWLGFQLSSVPIQRASELRMAVGTGALIESVVSTGNSTPAFSAGLQPGDICVRFDNRSVSGPLGLSRMVAAVKPGTKAELVVFRGNQELVLSAIVGKRPE